MNLSKEKISSGKKYRVAAVNAAGQATWVESNVAELPPNPVTDVAATYTG